MANRFDNVLQGHRKFVPQQWTPNVELMSSLLEQQQGQYDSAMQLADIPINNIRQDDEVAQNLRKKLRGNIDNLANIYKTEGVSAGNRVRNKMVRDVKQMVLPGGDISKLNKRVEQYKAHSDAIKEQYKDNPLIQQYHLKRLDEEGVLPFDDGRINAPSGMVRHVDSKEISEYLDKAIGNIKDTDLERLGLNREQLVNYNYLYETGKISGRKYQDIVNTLAAQLPEEFINSAQQFSNAQGRNVNERNLFTEDNKLNLDTQLGKIISGAAQGRAREDLDRKVGTFKDDYSLRAIDHDFKKKEIDYQYNKDKSYYELPTTSKDVVIDPKKEKQQIKLEKEKIKSAEGVINAFQQKVANKESISPEEYAIYEDALIDKTDSEFIIKAKGDNLSVLQNKTSQSLDSRIDSSVKDKGVADKMKQYVKDNPEADLLSAYSASGGQTFTSAGPDKNVPHPDFTSLSKQASDLDNEIADLEASEKTYHKNYTLVSGTPNTELAKQGKAYSDMFLRGNVSLVTDDAKLLNSDEISNKFAEGKIALLPVKEPINGRPGFAVIGTKMKEGSFFSDGEYGKTQEFVTFTGNNAMVKEQARRTYRDMYFNGDAVDQQSAAYGYGYYATSANSNMSVGVQIESLKLESKGNDYKSEAIKTPVGDVYITKFVDDQGNQAYRHDLYKSGTKERIKDAKGNDFTNLFNNEYGVTYNPNTIIEAVGKYQLQLEALK